MEIGRDRILLL